MRNGWALLLGATLLAGAAAAQTPAGFYVAAGIGANLPQETKVETRGGVQTALRNNSGDVRFEPMAMGLLALGYGFGNGIRVELEGSLRANAVDRATGFATLTPAPRAQGQLWNWGLMANAYLDIDVGSEWVRPYLGLGLGHVWSELRDFRVAGSRQRLAVDSSDGSFAYQAMVGASFPIAAIPGLAATAEYRFLGTSDADYTARVITAGQRTQQGGKVEISPYHHAILFGLRYAFGEEPAPPEPVAPIAPILAPAPPPPAAAPAPVTRSFILYFDTNSATLNARARQIITEAAQAAQTGTTTRIEVAGHTDRTGPAALNQRLSLRRAQSVAAELRRQGIRADDITIRGYGDTQPAVPTRAGVREQRNRRVEIVVR